MGNYFVVDAEYGTDNDARIDTEETLDVHLFMGKRLADTFPPTVITLRSRPALPDFLQVGSVVAVSERLRDFFRDEWVNAEYIELRMMQERRPAPVRYYCMNILDVVPCLDRATSKYTEFPPEAGGGILTISELFLDEEKVGERRLFVLDEKVRILIRNDLAERLHAEDFTGFVFRELPKGLF